MKVVLIVGNKNGGMVHYTSQLTNALKNFCDVVVVAPKGINREYFSNQVVIKEVGFLNIGKSLHKAILNSYDLSRIITAVYPDIIHILSPHLYISFVLPFLRKYPQVVTLHNPISLQTRSNFILLLSDTLINTIYVKNADMLIVHGNRLKEILSKRISERKIKVIPHGDYSFFKKWEKNSIKEEKSVLFFGFIAPYKGVEYLVKAAPLITEKISSAKIVVAGEGDFKRYEEEIRDKNHFEIYNKTIPNEQVAELFQRSSVVVLPYIKASQSGIIATAYAFRKPVVVTNVGALPEIVDNGKTGFVVPPKDSKALAEAIVKLLKDEKLRKEMGENAYRKMRKELSWDNIAEKTTDVYKDVVTTKTRRFEKSPEKLVPICPERL